MNKKVLVMSLVFMIIISTLLFVNISYAQEINQNICENGGGQWIIPSYSKEPFCQCGFLNNKYSSMIWNGTNCINITQEDICIRSQGNWANSECKCNNGEWVEGLGCQFLVYHKISMKYILLSVILLIIIMGIVWLIIKKYRGNSND